MDFGSRDIKIIVCMLLATIIVSYTMFQFGLAQSQDQLNESDRPNLSVETDKFDFARDLPRSPGSAQQGELIWNEKLEGDSQNVVWLDGDGSDGSEVVWINSNATGKPADMEVTVNEWSSGTATSRSFDMNESETKRDLESDTLSRYDIRFTFNEQYGNESNTTDDYRAYLDYTILNQTQSDSWYTRIPGVGRLFTTADQLEATVGWIGSIALWVVEFHAQAALNILVAGLDSIAYFFDLVLWVLDTFRTLIENASAWAAVFLIVPPAILLIEMAKLGMILIDLLWIG